MTTPASTPRPPARIHLSWAGEHRFDAGRPGAPAARIDASGQTGSSPVETLLSALAACTSVDVVDILAKRRTPVERLEVDVDGERVDAVPRRFSHIRLVYRVDGAGIDPVQAERAVDLAIMKYCSVRESLAPDIGIEWQLVVNGAAVGGWHDASKHG